ncbi:hypothetical protein JAAARDRAFT_714901, partial [Jaapia argillacea MUCL 33604]
VKVDPSISNAVASSSAQPISSRSASKASPTRRLLFFPQVLTFSKTSQDPYYGHEHTVRMGTRFVTHLFACPDLPTPLPPQPSTLTPPMLPSPRSIHHLRPPSYPTTRLRYLRCAISFTAPKCSIPRRSEIIGSPTIYCRLYDCFKSYLRRHVFEQVVDHRQAELVSAAGDNQMEREMCRYLGS